MIVVKKELAVQLVCAGLGEDLNPAKAHAVILRGEWVLVDADFADGRFGRKLAAGESVNVNLPAVGSGRRTGQRLEFGLQLIRIVRERVKIFAADHHAAGVIVRAGAHLGGVTLHLDVFFLDQDHHRDVELLHLAGDDLHFFRGRSKALGRDADRVLAGGQVLYVISARAICRGGDDQAAGVFDRDGGAGNYRSRLIDDLSAKMAGWGLGKQRTGTRNKNENHKSGDPRAVPRRPEFHQTLLNKKSFAAGDHTAGLLRTGIAGRAETPSGK